MRRGDTLHICLVVAVSVANLLSLGGKSVILSLLNYVLCHGYDPNDSLSEVLFDMPLGSALVPLKGSLCVCVPWHRSEERV